jgi:hypothetical protein
MKAFSVAKTIEASPQAVWSVLVDESRYPEWDPGMDRIEGTISPGEKIRIYTKLSPGRAFPATISEFVPARKMTWVGGMPLGLFKGERTFTLTPDEKGGTHFAMREVFTGILLPIFGRTIPDLTSSFEQFAEGLKSRAESMM